MLTFIIPAAPSVNGLYYNAPGKGRRRTKAYGTWRNAAGWAMKSGGGQARTWDTICGPVAVEIINGSPCGDIDNRCKAVLDLLVEMRVLVDDSQVSDLRVMRGGKPHEAVVTVRSIERGAA